MILFLISFIAGVLTVLAPCTISLLPVIVGGNIAEGHSKKRALVVTGISWRFGDFIYFDFKGQYAFYKHSAIFLADIFWRNYFCYWLGHGLS